MYIYKYFLTLNLWIPAIFFANAFASKRLSLPRCNPSEASNTRRLRRGPPMGPAGPRGAPWEVGNCWVYLDVYTLVI